MRKTWAWILALVLVLSSKNTPVSDMILSVFTDIVKSSLSATCVKASFTAIFLALSKFSCVEEPAKYNFFLSSLFLPIQFGIFFEDRSISLACNIEILQAKHKTVNNIVKNLKFTIP